MASDLQHLELQGENVLPGVLKVFEKHANDAGGQRKFEVAGGATRRRIVGVAA